MNYLVDGHNLIPKIPGLNLSMVDDEMRLVALLQVFARVRRAKVEVYFDQAPPGFSGTRRFGTVTAHFVMRGTSADDAIIHRLLRLQKEARAYTVVTSDRKIRREAQFVHAGLVTSEAFSEQLIQAAVENDNTDSEPGKVEGDELDEWLRLFGGDKE